ncbi:uncharacterized protein BX663DRAFT_547430 [Cokeromyces recurvatus]|uniref:uncharacterized protein n=1 Tax=Cokeromyces recurvatus TaxID=90255 RepID=UPI0022202768|nr:uncharacterized protein BX663DRAFT_547430 [Cokeromyces recurvatus]KAI7907750.1 hypothetical protein BX663DRAFT_547430 [Cokeromyces recurvatus]
MSKIRGSNLRKKDNDFDRNSKLLIIKEGAPNVERQLFDPHTDHPIRFNKNNKSDNEPRNKETNGSYCQSPSRKPLADFARRPPPTSGRRLWTADIPSVHGPPKSRNEEKSIIPKIVLSPNPKTKLEKKVLTPTTSPKLIQADIVSLNPEELQKDAQRKKLKSLVVNLRTIESKLKDLVISSRSLPCFYDTKALEDHDTRRSKLVAEEGQNILTEQDILDAEKVWKEKIDLHLSLGEKYLEILKCDFDYAEKKGLESLCWKKAIYSLVDQFRKALTNITDHLNTTPINSAEIKEEECVSSKGTQSNSDLATILLDDCAVDDSLTEMPVIHEGGGMTFVKLENPKPDKIEENNHKLRLKQMHITLTLFLKYLDLADNFYLQLTTFLKDIDNEEDDDIEKYLVQWRRTKKYKWYSCIPLRGDIARYRWSSIPKEEYIPPVPLENDMDYDDMNSRYKSEITKWTKSEAFKEAWKRYFLGIWLMPAKGNLYFNLSLLLQQSQSSQSLQGYEFHKLYFSIRSLMVRHNGFLNARESILALFEGNRRWIKKYLDSNTAGSKSKNKRTSSKAKLSILTDKNLIIPALFIRLHGLLFTKIGLDELPRIKRSFFNALFGDSEPQIIQTQFEQLQISKENPKEDQSSTANDHKQLSMDHLFWFEMVILCISSLYTYDFANSKLTKLLSVNSARLFYSNEKEEYQELLEDVKENILFTYGIDLTCQIATELFQRYIDSRLLFPTIPSLPHLPYVSLKFMDIKDFLFDPVQDNEGNRIHLKEEEEETRETDIYAWLIYIETLFHWMVLNGICLRTQDQPSLWEALISDIGYDLVAYQRKRFPLTDNGSYNSKISPAFWPLLIQFLNKLLLEIPNEIKYDIVNKHLMEDNSQKTTLDSTLEYSFSKNIMSIMGSQPDLPEEDLLRGLGWVDDIHGRFLKLEPVMEDTCKLPIHNIDMITRRKIKILEYGFTLVKHLDDLLYYDPVEEIFTVSKSIEKRVSTLKPAATSESSLTKQQTAVENLYEENTMTIAEIEDDVLLSSETEFDEQNDGDDIMTQLKKRREQLQSIVASAEAEERFGYRRLPARAMEREARLNYLRERIIPGKTVLVLDTNCFIGHIEHVKYLLESQKWSIVIPLVVVTELDGLKTNTQKLGLVAQQGIELIEHSLANKPKQSTCLRIQTSHNNFMNDISIRSEQFVFGETDKNLDDLILSTCLWWTSQQNSSNNSHQTVPVCLITGDRNLSVKARARDVEVVPVSAIIQLTPKN